MTALKFAWGFMAVVDVADDVEDCEVDEVDEGRLKRVGGAGNCY